MNAGPFDATPEGEAAARLLRERVRSTGLWIAVDGTSMGRAIRAGSHVLIETADRGPHLGEIWAYLDVGGVLVVHRYLGSTGGALRFAGDAQGDDAPLQASMLIGRAVRLREDGNERRLGRAEQAGALMRVAPPRIARAVARRLGARRLRDWLAR